ncbi:MAG TPA: adenylate/guanylate cyclase domain-containing protein [Anaeromyxobacteraceae bacterium]|nr:adenylate/guanylate cyclase domain-containing protein [Anaeromyxobacteraceae bacterium]
MRSENLAVMLTDIQGFTAATARQTRAENARMLALHDALLLPVVRAFRGRRIKTIGDAYLILFDAPSSAVLCGAAIQDRLWDYNRRVAGARRIEVRVAVTLGDVRVVKVGGATDVYGEAVNLASRIEDDAPAGEVWVSESVQLAMAPEIPLQEIGWREMKGVPDAVRLWKVAPAGNAAGDAGEAPPYGNAALERVRGLPAPEPEIVAKLADAEQRSASRAGKARDGAVRLLVAAALAGGAVAAWLWFRRPEAERDIERGRFEEAKARIDARAADRGDQDPLVLYLRGKLERVRSDVGEGSLDQAFRVWSHALAAGSGEALDALTGEARSPDCGLRRLAAQALSEARVESARRALEDVARHEPPLPAAGAPARLQRPARADGRCGDGDVAREGLRVLDQRRDR